MDSQTAEAAHQSPVEYYRTGLWLFLLSEVMIFVLLLSVRFVFAGGGHPAELSQPLAVAMTVILLGSSWPAWQAAEAIASDDEARFMWHVGITIILGTVFLGLMAYEWMELAVAPSSLYGTAFFTITGLHGFHVLAGVAAYVSVWVRGRKGMFSSEDYWAVEAAERYWHFVDLVWVFIYPVMYLM